MYKDKEKQREANRLAKQRGRQGMTLGMTSQGMTDQGMTSYQLPSLPYDEVLTCNADVTWDDVLSLSKELIDEVYHAARIMGTDVLLRLKRAAGYHMRVRNG